MKRPRRIGEEVILSIQETPHDQSWQTPRRTENVERKSKAVRRSFVSRIQNLRKSKEK